MLLSFISTEVGQTFSSLEKDFKQKKLQHAIIIFQHHEVLLKTISNTIECTNSKEEI
eukprot:TRINITY_DN3211_c1_g1_i5.p1 TRINITY_DN3211_c1_g1~~TRINITY_DN3211_c1_g1_i5.p1  ORF type:complete len:57 (+),score=11.23 TRINITY_DN3211_c1_g1_i5:684-854(+)